MEETKIGLVLEGGGMRGIYTAGVLDELMEAGIQADGMIGVSAGVIHGVSYASHQYARNIRYFVKYRKDKRFMSLYSLITSGNLCGTEFCYDTIPNELAVFDFERFRKQAEEMPFYVCCTNVESGKAEYIRLYDAKEQMDVIRASASMPLVSEIVEYDGMKLLDGGTADSIPVEKMQELGFSKNIVVLTQPDGYVKKADKSLPVMRRVYKEYPEYIEACKNRYLQYNRTLEYLSELTEQGKAIVIQPSRDLKLSQTEKNIDKLKRMYKLGRFDTKNLLDDIQKFMVS